MSWLQLALGIVSLLKWLTATLHDNKVFRNGEEHAIADAMRRAADEVSKANAAGQAAEANARQGKYDPDLFRNGK